MIRAHPPKNRATKSLPVLRIEVTHAHGTDVYDPNTFTVLCAQKGFRWSPVPDIASELSGLPAVIYRSSNLVLHLTPDEVRRLVLTSLTPEEFRHLLGKFGDAFEWHDDFYDFRTGEALQPRAR